MASSTAWQKEVDQGALALGEKTPELGLGARALESLKVADEVPAISDRLYAFLSRIEIFRIVRVVPESFGIVSPI